jgi:uncharacterized cupin superfamily protein
MDRTPVPEAKLVDTDVGKKPEGEGWFVVNVGDAVAMGVDDDVYGMIFEGQFGGFKQFGINVRVLAPGKPAAMYHAESGQEAFLVLHGEAVLIVENEERPLKQWDFVHCPPNTAHVIVGAGDGPSIVLAVGTRPKPEDDKLLYPKSELAERYGASAEEETPDPQEAYARFDRPRPARPDYWDELPWASG